MWLGGTDGNWNILRRGLWALDGTGMYWEELGSYWWTLGGPGSH